MRLLLLVCTLLLAVNADADHGINKEVQALIDSLEKVRAEAGAPGMGLVLVSDKGPVYIGGFGVMDTQSKQPINKDTVFRVGSISKTFTALAMLKLQQQGKLGIDDEVRQHVAKPPYSNQWASTNPVTISELLEHTAGLNGLSEKEFKHDQKPPITLEDAFKVDPQSRELRWQPGLHYSYTNTGPGITAHVLEQVSKLTFEEYMQREIFKPLDMPRSSFLLTDDLRPDLANAYDKEGEVLEYWDMLYRPFGALNTTLPEMSHFIQMLINQGSYNNQSIVPAAAIARMERSETTLAARHGLQHGYGLGNEAWYYGNHLFHGHGGQARGYISQFGYSRENNLGYFVTLTSAHSGALDKMQQTIEEWLVKELPDNKLPEPVKLDRVVINSLIGEYQQVTQRFDNDIQAITRVLTDGEKLFTQVDAGPLEVLVAVNSQLFRRENEPAATIAIVPDNKGNLHFQSGAGSYKKLEKTQ